RGRRRDRGPRSRNRRLRGKCARQKFETAARMAARDSSPTIGGILRMGKSCGTHYGNDVAGDARRVHIVDQMEERILERLAENFTDVDHRVLRNYCASPKNQHI